MSKVKFFLLPFIVCTLVCNFCSSSENTDFKHDLFQDLSDEWTAEETEINFEVKKDIFCCTEEKCKEEYGDVGQCKKVICDFNLCECKVEFLKQGSACDDNDPCTENDECNEGGECVGKPIVCNDPPLNVCVDVKTLRKYQSEGVCESGKCVYDYTDENCELGCLNGRCKVSYCDGLPEGSPCDDGDPCTIDDRCGADGSCAGEAMDCNDPPKDECIDFKTLRKYNENGTCKDGECVYSYTDVNCDLGCINFKCKNSVCDGMVEGTPCDDQNPCTIGDKCDGAGSCSGTPLPCNTPPGNFCIDNYTARIFEAFGQCQNGTCEYNFMDKECPLGCLNGKCKNTFCEGLKEGTPCDDGDPCTVGDQCDGNGNCKGEIVICNDPPANFCTDDNTLRVYQDNGECKNGECVYPFLDVPCSASCVNGECVKSVCEQLGEGASCDDGDPCTKNDKCDDQGNCVGTPYTCPSGNNCFSYVCDGQGGCLPKVEYGYCIIDGNCYYDGDINPENSCQKCSSNVDPFFWTPVATNKSCDDGDPLTEGDHCEEGVCKGTPITCMPSDKLELLQQNWNYRKEVFKSSLTNGLENNNSSILYYNEVYLINFVFAAEACKKLDWIDGISNILLVAFKDKYLKPYKEYKIWLNDDGSPYITLNVSQFLYLVSKVINIIANLPENERTQNMNKLLSKAQYILDNHYLRLILEDPSFSTSGWGCNGGIGLNLKKELTISAWIKINTYQSGMIVNMLGTTYNIKLDNSGKLKGRIILDTPDPSTGKKYTVVEFVSFKKVPKDGKWHHVVLTYNSKIGVAKIYLDKTVAASINTPKAEVYYNNNTGQIFIGGYYVNNSYYSMFKGYIDEVRLFNRALSSSEVVQLYNCKTGAGCNPQGIVSSWTLNGNGNDIYGTNSLTRVNASFVSDGVSGQALYFDGQYDYASTFYWKGPLVHKDMIMGKFLENMRDDENDPEYCNAVLDTDLWIVGGLIELLSVYKLHPDLFDLSPVVYEELMNYIDLSIEFVQSRFKDTTLLDFNGNAVKGVILDPGIWKKHPDYRYAGYTGETYPVGNIDPVLADNDVGWDISHSRRFVAFFETLYKKRWFTKKYFPDFDFMKKLSNQFIYATFNGDLKYPLFTNYMDGTNGWYRAGYKGKNFGYRPYDLSMSAITSGYGFWKKYNKDYELLNDALWNMIISTDPSVIKHFNDHYGTRWENGTVINDFGDKNPSTSVRIFMFLPVFAVY